LTKSNRQLIANIDADNVITEKWIKKALKTFKNNKVVALSGPYRFYDLSPFHEILAKIYYWLAYPFFVLFNQLLKKGGAVMGGNLIFRKEALEASNGYNTSLEFYGDDTDTAQRLSKVGLVIFDYNFFLYSSGRRLNKQGIFKMAFKYFINYIWIIIFKKPFHKI
jgi:cellulose synthase/poly-beta-1,6-N-acetylglucosamine synthase-like glycosyltransferase